jgi:nucleotide-binding universal stress UspA family protein
MIRSIALTLDGSELAEHAGPIAVDLARRSGGTLHLLEVHEPIAPLVSPPAEMPPPIVDDDRKAREQDYLKRASERYGSSLGRPVQPDLADGPAGPTIAEWARRTAPDLLVMATHGRGPVSRFWLGSIADYVIRHAPVPVLLVRPTAGSAPAEATPIRTILLPVDQSDGSEAIIPAAVEIAKLYGARIVLFHAVAPSAGFVDLAMPMPDHPVTDIARGQRERAELRLAPLAARLSAEGVPVSTAISLAGGAAAAILEQVDREPCDLIAMTTRAAPGLPRMIVGSVADKVIRAAKQPVLVLHPAGRAP